MTAENGTAIDQVGHVRTADGTLHLAWHHAVSPNAEDLLHTSITPGGAIGATSPIASGWASLEDPALVVAPDGLRVFFGGLRSTDSSDPQRELNSARSADGGATWALHPGSVVASGAQPYASAVAATSLPDGSALQAWAGSLGTWVHAGLDPASPNHDYQAPHGPYGYDPGIATDVTGTTVMAWYSSASARSGVLAQLVGPGGAPAGGTATMPGTAGMTIGMLSRTPIAARAGGGFYVGYPTGVPMKTVRVWRVGDAAAARVARTSGQGNQPVTVAAAPDGRIWVAWADQVGGVPRVLARRSNPGVTRWGATVAAGRAAGSPGAYALDASVAPDEGLDLLAVFGIGTTSNAATYHRRIRPGLSLSAAPATLRRGRRSRVTFTVTDAGDPVKGATVKAGGRAVRTDGKGRGRLRVRGSGSRLTAKATRDGYTAAKRRLTVRR